MPGLQIKSGEIVLSINDDPERVIRFNPHDVNFVERFYNLIAEFETRVTEFENRSKAIDENKEADANGLPLNVPERIQLMREACDYIRGKIDHLFGAGTSQTAFGDVLSLDGFVQFFEGITPHIQQARISKTEKYTSPDAEKRKRRKA